MANITLLTSTKYNIVSITASTKTIIVSGNASAQITAGRRFRLAGTASDDGFYTVVTSVYSSPNTTIVCTEELSDDGVAVGTADLQRVLATGADWVGGVAPGVSDVGIIPSNGNLNGSGNSGSLTCESGGTVTLDNASYNNGSLTCFLYGTVTGATPIQFTIEKRTTHFTGNLAGSINIRNDTKALHESGVVAAASDVRKDIPRWTGATGADVGILDIESDNAAVQAAELVLLNNQKSKIAHGLQITLSAGISDEGTAPAGGVMGGSTCLGLGL